MLIVTIEKRDAVTGEHSVLHRYAIINDGTGNSEVGHYRISPMIGDAIIPGSHRITWFDRMQHNGAMRLAMRVLQLIDDKR